MLGKTRPREGHPSSCCAEADANPKWHPKPKPAPEPKPQAQDQDQNVAFSLLTFHFQALSPISFLIWPRLSNKFPMPREMLPKLLLGISWARGPRLPRLPRQGHGLLRKDEDEFLSLRSARIYHSRFRVSVSLYPTWLPGRFFPSILFPDALPSGTSFSDAVDWCFYPWSDFWSRGHGLCCSLQYSTGVLSSNMEVAINDGSQAPDEDAPSVEGFLADQQTT